MTCARTTLSRFSPISEVNEIKIWIITSSHNILTDTEPTNPSHVLLVPNIRRASCSKLICRTRMAGTSMRFVSKALSTNLIQFNSTRFNWIQFNPIYFIAIDVNYIHSNPMQSKSISNLPPNNHHFTRIQSYPYIIKITPINLQSSRICDTRTPTGMRLASNALDADSVQFNPSQSILIHPSPF